MNTSNTAYFSPTLARAAVRPSWPQRLLLPALALLVTLLAGCGGGDDGGGGGDNEPPPVADTTAPSVPESVTATAQSATSVLISWTASTDAGSGVAGYRIYRDDDGTTPIATVSSGTTYTDTGLTGASTYSYAVTAFDNANPANESAKSSAVTVTTPTSTGQLKLSTERVFANLAAFESPVLALQAPEDGATWYVVEQAGRVVAFDDNADVSAKRTFVDLRSRVRSGGEAGLLGMAFHPDYPATPRVYLSYTADVDGKLVSRISAFDAASGGASLDDASETILLTVEQPAANHNGGHIAFGPDGFLYIGFGDGGGKDDEWGEIGNGQDLTTLLGKMLRIDVDGVTSASVPYRIPQDNPHAANAPCNAGTGAQECPEIFAYGFRNPWRWSFDRGTGTLWVGDVGESAREEVNRVTLGGNYGWRCLEGTLAHNADCGSNAGVALPPVAEYTHEFGSSVTGGYVYRGEQMGPMKGRYIFGDFINGRVWHIARDREPTRAMTVDAASETGRAIASFAEDAEGELFIVDYDGTLHRLVVAE
jgi:glucose/arabinose dehydrogenase